MNDDEIIKYDCQNCCYRNIESNFCGFCMIKILNEMNVNENKDLDLEDR